MILIRSKLRSNKKLLVTLEGKDHRPCGYSSPDQGYHIEHGPLYHLSDESKRHGGTCSEREG